ncbi:class I SAM-dependent methyltransferase [Natranaeroarchaeum sulfidigenes]|uniref:SAM-dependent methyltransferase n=1 Tax=Natranaeroarchaeum sulfidigenes TaxID=2784880 RepID=A0A897MNT0_9EURY|nr:class I SAM-dependent methyltransferase [Natranaeroarchaeum sulfidigenes]QSG02244.1 SAM-dependent methyltransferase [Natranaeroarchaeum sulfidigenes]
MTKTPDDHGERFDEIAAEYDEDQSPEYRACVELVVEHADPDGEETLLDLGAGTGAIALALAEDAGRVLGRDVSEGMLEQAREKATEREITNIDFREGRFREPNVDGEVHIVTSNFAMHHLSDEEKREAIDVIAGLGPRKFVLGDVMFFGEPDPGEPFYSPEVDDPATVGLLADALTDAEFALTAVEPVHEQVGVLVAERSHGDGAQ